MAAVSLFALTLTLTPHCLSLHWEGSHKHTLLLIIHILRFTTSSSSLLLSLLTHTMNESLPCSLHPLLSPAIANDLVCLQEAKVILVPGTDMFFHTPGMFRLCFTSVGADVLEVTLRRILSF